MYKVSILLKNVGFSQIQSHDPSNFVSNHNYADYPFSFTSPTTRRDNKAIESDNKVIDGLSTATHVFIRHDAVRKPLQPPYDGPYPVIKGTDKHFTIDING